MKKKPKTAAQIVADCNELAAKLAEAHGRDVPTGYRFDQAEHPAELNLWQMAVIAYAHIENVDAEESLRELEET